VDAQEWNERYRLAGDSGSRVWSDVPNEALVKYAPYPRVPGELAALDLGCGEGADALWLAAHGWVVTAVDWAEVALARGRAAARDAGHKVRFVRGDITDAQYLTSLSATGLFDLVTLAFVHPEPDERESAYAHLPRLVAPGGNLLVIAHDPEHGVLGLGGPPPHRLLSPADIVAALRLPDDHEVLVSEVRARTLQDEVVALDSIVLVHREA
jgi:SAM-dependent methyltransferase